MELSYRIYHHQSSKETLCPWTTKKDRCAGTGYLEKVYRCNVRSVLEYDLQVWQNIPVYLSERIESVQKRAFKIIYPDSSYNQALILAKETTLSSGREFLWNKLMADMNKNSDHPLSFPVSAPENITIPYNLRSGAVRPITKLRRTKRTEDIFLHLNTSNFN